MKIKDIMAQKIIAVSVEEDIAEIGSKMKQYDIGFVPIEKDNKIIGVLTDRDIVTKIVANKDDKINGYFTDKIISIDQNKELADALNLMGEHKIKRLIVTDNEKVVGIVSLSDILNNQIALDKIIENINRIYEITKNDDNYDIKVSDFYL